MIKCVRNGNWCILLYTAAATYYFMDMVTPKCEIQIMPDGAIELSFTSASAREAVYDMLNEILNTGAC